MDQLFKKKSEHFSIGSRKRGGSSASSVSNGTDSLKAYKYDRSHSEVRDSVTRKKSPNVYKSCSKMIDFDNFTKIA